MWKKTFRWAAIKLRTELTWGHPRQCPGPCRAWPPPGWGRAPAGSPGAAGGCSWRCQEYYWPDPALHPVTWRYQNVRPSAISDRTYLWLIDEWCNLFSTQVEEVKGENCEKISRRYNMQLLSSIQQLLQVLYANQVRNAETCQIQL